MRFGSSAAAGNAMGKGLGSIFAPNSDATAAGTLAGLQIKNLQGQIDERAAKQAAADAEAARTSDKGILKTALLSAGVPEDAAVRDYQEKMATGQTPERYQLPADAAGPTMDKPAYLNDGTQKNLLTMLAALRATGGGAKSMDDFAKFQEAQQGIGFKDRYVDPNTPANEVARLGSVTKSSDIYKTGENGARLDVYGGGIDTNNPVFPVWKGNKEADNAKSRAAAAASYAQARSADAAAGEHVAGAELKRAIAAGKLPAAGEDGKPKDKPMPGPALKMQDEHIGTIGSLDTVNGQIDEVLGKIERGDLKLGAARNLMNQGKNFIGAGDDQSKAFADLSTTVEGIRNGVLLLNKGVQTEGDAVRALKQITPNLNDPGVVVQQLKKLKELNNKAAENRLGQVNRIRGNYGNAPLGMDEFTKSAAPAQPAAGSLQDQAAAELKRRQGAGAQAAPGAPPEDPVRAELKRRGVLK
jgi:hypothetical protein